MPTLPIFQDLGISVLLRLLVGLQRQFVDAPLEGVRRLTKWLHSGCS